MFVRAPNPIWYLPDLLGFPLNDEYFAFFLTNTLPYLPQDVYRDPQGQTVWTNDIVRFFPNGTLPDNLYFDPTMVYRIEIRHGDSQADELIYEINNFVPGPGNSTVVTPFPILFAENLISNSNFGLVNFTASLTSSGEPTLTISTAGTYNIAPGWQLILAGVGTTTITQKIYTGIGVVGEDNSPNYALLIANSGWTTAVLQQQLQRNGAIFGGGAVSMSALVMSTTGSVTISMNYEPSTGTPQIVVPPTTVGSGTYVTIEGTINLANSMNNDLSTSAFVNVSISLPATGSFDITDIQFNGQSDAIPGFDPGEQITTVVPIYQQDSEERKVDHLFHYFAGDIITKPKRSLLTGWNFPLNPYQFITPTLTTVTAITSYIADQTILHQEAASQLQSGQNVVAQRENLLIKAVTAATTTRFALIQYIDPTTIAAYWSYILSSLARTRIVTVNGTQVRLKCRLIWRTTLPSAISATEPIASWPPAGDPIFGAGWTAIAPLNDPAYILPNSYITGSTTNVYPAVAFEQMQLPDSSATTMTLGIVIYTMDNLNSTSDMEDSIEFDQISLIPTRFAADALPQTQDEVLLDCQYYYKKSYSQGVLPGTATQPFAATTSISVFAYGTGVSFYTERYSPMRAAATTATIYSSNSGAANTVFDTGSVSDRAVHAINIGDNAFMVQTQTGISGANIALQWHYTVDARLGV